MYVYIFISIVKRSKRNWWKDKYSGNIWKIRRTLQEISMRKRGSGNQTGTLVQSHAQPTMQASCCPRPLVNSQACRIVTEPDALWEKLMPTVWFSCKVQKVSVIVVCCPLPSFLCCLCISSNSLLYQRNTALPGSGTLLELGSLLVCSASRSSLRHVFIPYNSDKLNKLSHTMSALVFPLCSWRGHKT